MNNINKAALASAITLITGGAAFAQGNATITEKLSNRTVQVAQNRSNRGVNIETILIRASALAQAAQSRANSAKTPTEAKTSYRNALAAFNQIVRYRAQSATANTAFVSVSSSEAEQDIRTLRTAMRNTSGVSAQRIRRVAELYAAGTREFFTAQLREALYTDDFAPSDGFVTMRFSNKNYGIPSPTVQEPSLPIGGANVPSTPQTLLNGGSGYVINPGFVYPSSPILVNPGYSTPTNNPVGTPNVPVEPAIPVTVP